MALEVIYRKNPLFGQPGEPEMLPPEEVERPDPEGANAPAPTKAELLAKIQELIDAVSAIPDEEGP